MPVIFLFPIDKDPLLIPEVSSSMAGCLGFPCFLYESGRKLAPAELPDGGAMGAGKLWVELPELDAEDGLPVVTFEVSPRLDREDEVQQMVDEIIDQDESLREAMDRNAYDVLLTYEDTQAGVEAAHCLAYVLAAGTGAGVLVPGNEAEEEETLWFDNADDFADMAFGDDDESDDEEE